MKELQEELVALLAQTVAGFARNEIRIEAEEAASPLPLGASKFGGIPDCPPDFVWPYYEGKRSVTEREEDAPVTFTDAEWIRAPLTFLAQFDCREASAFDREGLLPREGVLSFFYELNTERWGFDPADEGCARVFWFPPETALVPTLPPADARLPDWVKGERIPPCSLTFSAVRSLPSYDDFGETEEESRMVRLVPHGTFWAYFDAAVKRLGWEEDDFGDRHKLLGWPDVIQDAMTFDLEMVTSGYYMGDGSGMDKLTRDEKVAMAKKGREEWILLFQMGTVRAGDFRLMWGECGHIYFWIRLQDLKNRDFSRIWLIQQCC